ncbi:hypothetical protein Fuma_01197 [Fuerstiella marisgermanici]|uniref:Uncharacterized protein n=1 Tax=Fuerstiella marisgermanici TaxID=1891926 RepID=A0A1P8WC18_9PLAN|nr:hypothetical protein Fuma_01197 [Fuerstiella marisgermanici]
MAKVVGAAPVCRARTEGCILIRCLVVQRAVGTDFVVLTLKLFCHLHRITNTFKFLNV